MDPRPYHFDYRRPRPNNPTYRSDHLFDRIQQLQLSLSKKLSNPQQNLSTPPFSLSELKRANSTDLNAGKTSQMSELGRYSSRSGLGPSEKGTSMAGYGRSILGQSRMEQLDVFEKQEKDFNIINYGPRPVRPTLRQFPRLTLQDKLLEMRAYPGQSQ